MLKGEGGTGERGDGGTGDRGEAGTGKEDETDFGREGRGGMVSWSSDMGDRGGRVGGGEGGVSLSLFCSSREEKDHELGRREAMDSLIPMLSPLTVDRLSLEGWGRGVWFAQKGCVASPVRLRGVVPFVVERRGRLRPVHRSLHRLHIVLLDRLVLGIRPLKAMHFEWANKSGK